MRTLELNRITRLGRFKGSRNFIKFKINDNDEWIGLSTRFAHLITCEFNLLEPSDLINFRLDKTNLSKLKNILSISEHFSELIEELKVDNENIKLEILDIIGCIEDGNFITLNIFITEGTFQTKYK